MTRGGKRPGAGRPAGSRTERTANLNIRATPAELERWRAAADDAGLDLSAWVRYALDQAFSNCTEDGPDF